MSLRDDVLRHQQALTNNLWNDDLPLKVEVWKKNSGRSLSELFAIYGREKLARLNFIHSEEEPLIGRVEYPFADPELSARAKAEIAALDIPLNKGQTGHAEPFYDEVLQNGIDSVKSRIKGDQAFLIAIEGISAMIMHAGAASCRQDTAEVCARIAHHPPRTFHEALQLIFFIDLAIQAGDQAFLIGPGRVDRRLIKFYENDLASGRISRQDALKMLETFYLAINYNTCRGLAYAVMVGGNGQYNELSYLALEALRNTRLVYPSVGVCWESSTPADLRSLAVEMICDGIANVAIFNDELIQRSMIRYGVTPETAHEYINSTCVEITPCGSSNVYVASPYFSLCSILLEYMENSTAADYPAFLQGFLKMLGRRIAEEAKAQNELRRYRYERIRRPIQSLFTLDCIARNLDIEAGGAKYNWVECSFVGLANLADSLTVIRKEVFEAKNLSLAELLEILKHDFEGNEALRLKFLNHYPKYGNGDLEADSVIPVITGFIVECCAAQKMFPDDSCFIPGTFCWEMHQHMGKECIATPDGRHGGAPFADGAGPAQGREHHGPTAAIRSVCSWDHSVMLGGSAFNQRYTSATVASREARKKLEALIATFIDRGGFETQINILDAGTLREAQLHPEEYRDLLVRIGGYTDYFTGLSPEMQHEVITRTLYQEL